MKILLTVVVNGSADDKSAATLYDGIELIYPDKDENEKDFLVRAAKNVKGKYAVLIDHKFFLADVQPLLNILDKNTADMVCFTGGVALKSSIVKGAVKDCEDCFSLRLLSVLACKNLLKTIYNPFAVDKHTANFTEKNIDGLMLAAEEFGRVKAKLTKEIYSYSFNMLCDRLIAFYAYAMLAIREGAMDRGVLVEFDNKLKAQIVLYLALEKRFTAVKLNKLREKEFKISYFTALRLKSLL